MIVNKLTEAKFFLGKMEECGCNAFEFNCYFSAFVTSARSFTWSVKKHMSAMKGFDGFWEKLMSGKLNNETAKKFVRIRNFIEKEVDNRIIGGSVWKEGKEIKTKYFFKNDTEKDVLSWCSEYFVMLEKVRELIVKRFKLDAPSSEYYWQDIIGLGGPV